MASVRNAPESDTHVVPTTMDSESSENLTLQESFNQPQADLNRTEVLRLDESGLNNITIFDLSWDCAFDYDSLYLTSDELLNNAFWNFGTPALSEPDYTPPTPELISRVATPGRSITWAESPGMATEDRMRRLGRIPARRAAEKRNSLNKSYFIFNQDPSISQVIFKVYIL